MKRKKNSRDRPQERERQREEYDTPPVSSLDFPRSPQTLPGTELGCHPSPPDHAIGGGTACLTYSVRRAPQNRSGTFLSRDLEVKEAER